MKTTAVLLALLLGIAWASLSLAQPVATVKDEMDGFCKVADDAEKKLRDSPQRAYDQVMKEHIIALPDFAKAARGISRLEWATQYQMLLRYARKDHQLQDWSCPSFDRLTMRLVSVEAERAKLMRSSRRPMRPATYVIESHLDGRVLLNGTKTSIEVLHTRLEAMKSENARVFLYREGWQKIPHRNAEVILNRLVDLRFIFAFCVRADCGERADVREPNKI